MQQSGTDPQTFAVVAIFGVAYLGMVLGGLPRPDRSGVPVTRVTPTLTALWLKP